MPPIASIPRLARILALVPWVVQHPDEATVTEVCRRFSITRDQLMDDLSLLLVCGLPPFSPGDMIEAEVEDDRVVIRMADYLARPLRLTKWDALSLLAAGRALAEVPALAETAPLESALGKLAAAIAPEDAEAAAMLAERVAIELEPASPETLRALNTAIQNRQRVRIEYYSFGRDELTERAIDPLIVYGGRPWYLHAFDHQSGERRTFRVDRIRSITPTQETFDVPDGFDADKEVEAPLYRPSPGDVKVVLDLSPDALWVAEVTPHDHAEPGPNGRTIMTLHASHTAWLARLLLQLGDEARVLEPESLAGEVRALAKVALTRYGA